MAKTLIDLDPDLLERAQRALGGEGEVTKKAAVTEGLRRIVAADAFAELVDDVASMTDEQRDLMLSWRR